ncbi:MAG: hypothetical protein IKC11_02340 [Clostridia bacterium]|nr:hypothetical protein [Clostridia bacterium]
MYEYIVTAFKVMVGVITNDRLAIGAAVALGIMLLWVTFSLIFSFQARFARGVRKINNYVSRNGISGDAKAGLDELISKMPNEFQRGYKAFERNPKSLPSENIKRFESLDVELSGGVFNQNKSVLKTYMNFIFVTLLLFSFALLQDATMTGYLIAEAFITPVIFLLVAKVIYYVYTAIRQNQYRTAVDDFSDMLDNLDKSAMDSFGAGTNYQEKVDAQDLVFVPVANAVVDGREDIIALPEEPVLSEEQNDVYPEDIVTTEEIVDEDVQEIAEEVVAEVKEPEEEAQEIETVEIVEEPVQEESIQEAQEIKEEVLTPPHTLEELGELSAIQEYRAFVERAKKEAEIEKANNAEPAEVEQEDVEDIEQNEVKSGMMDNFTPDFSSLLEEEQVEVKRGRGRPRKEVKDDGEFIIKNDKEFEDALVRAEKLMRKNEEPLSASQTKRIEKQIKELVDAMTKYKEGK